ncbi:uncharacterized protein LOC115077075 isoform X2 [Rhinatrema bivittatum]|uniref:uncharacterized protein LOC115077075 isoform X2 n=1 Tax=Rhinatrema bivittatum TaxID=194408 RepID=UPI00112E7BEF|nr:uncharacterized protein LOC115077075 isoform X2 [Rhinatrema bivittatum]
MTCNAPLPLLCLLALIYILNGWTAASGKLIKVYGIPNGSAVFRLEKRNLENSSVTWRKGNKALSCHPDLAPQCKILDDGALLLLEKLSWGDEGNYTAEVLGYQSNDTENDTREFLLKLLENIPEPSPTIEVTCLGDGRRILSCERGMKGHAHWALDGRNLTEAEVSLKDNGSKLFICQVQNPIRSGDGSAIVLNCADADESLWSLYHLITLGSAGGVLLLAVTIAVITSCCCCYMKKQRYSPVHQEENGMELVPVSKKPSKEPTSQDEVLAEDARLVCLIKDTEQAGPDPSQVTSEERKDRHAKVSIEN